MIDTSDPAQLAVMVETEVVPDLDRFLACGLLFEHFGREWSIEDAAQRLAWPVARARTAAAAARERGFIA